MTTAATYKNPFYTQGDRFSRPEYTVEVRPYKYKGYLIYQRIRNTVFDVVKDGVIITMMAGIDGAKRAIDELTPEPVNAWGRTASDQRGKSQQLRLDKAARKYGARVRRGANTVRNI